MDSTLRTRQYFIVNHDFISGKQKVAAGCLGYYVDADQGRGRILDFKPKCDMDLGRGHMRPLSRREASFLYAVDSLPQRHRLANDGVLLASICSMQTNDVVRLRHNRTVAVGIVKSIWEFMSKADPTGLVKLRIEVQLLDDGESVWNNEKCRLKTDAGQILTASTSVVQPSRCRALEGKLSEKAWSLSKEQCTRIMFSLFSSVHTFLNAIPLLFKTFHKTV